MLVLQTFPLQMIVAEAELNRTMIVAEAVLNQTLILVEIMPKIRKGHQMYCYSKVKIQRGFLDYC